MKYAFLFISLLAVAPKAAEAQQADTMLMVHLNGLEITDSRIFSDSMRYRYNQLKQNVEVVLPYLAKATQLYHNAGSYDNKKAKRKYLDKQEERLRDEFKDKLKNLTVTQGKLLVKLISRQTGQPLYDLLKEYESSFTAVKWQTWAKLNGYDLRDQYDPQADRNLEHIMRELGYPLPQFYEDRATAQNQ
jgi:hypothetical protein